MNYNYVIQGLFLGIILAVIIIGYNKLLIGKFVKALIKANANHPAFAKSFDDLNLRRNIFWKIILRPDKKNRNNNGLLKKIVAQVDNNSDNNDDESENEREYNNIKYYIPEEKLYRAERLYGGKDVDFLMLAAIIIFLFIFYAVFTAYFPAFMDAISGSFDKLVG